MKKGLVIFAALVLGALPMFASSETYLNGIKTLYGAVLTSPVITGGTIDNTVIGGTTPAAGAFDTPFTIQSTTDSTTAVQVLDADGGPPVLNVDTTNEIVAVGTTDTDGTPATGRLTVKGSTNDGSTNILVGRDSDEANVFVVTTDGDVTVTGDVAASGTLQGNVIFNSYSSAQTLTAATHNSSIVQMTVAGEVTMWDATASTVGQYVTLWARDAEKIEVVPASGDNFVLFDGTAITADYELDMAAIAGNKVTLLCTAADTWSVYSESFTSTDGGVAD